MNIEFFLSVIQLKRKIYIDFTTFGCQNMRIYKKIQKLQEK